MDKRNEEAPEQVGEGRKGEVMSVCREDIKTAIENGHMVRTSARERAILNGRAIDIAPDNNRVKTDSHRRAEWYLEVATHLKNVIKEANSGVTMSELEDAELIIEMLEANSRRAVEVAIKNY